MATLLLHSHSDAAFRWSVLKRISNEICQYLSDPIFISTNQRQSRLDGCVQAEAFGFELLLESIHCRMDQVPHVE